MNWKKILAAAVLACLGACAPFRQNDSYLNTRWGMSERALKKARPLSDTPTESSGNRFWFEHATIAELKATVAYQMGPHGLQSVTIVFDPIKVDKAQYIDHYHKIQELLNEKYGSPEVDSASVTAMAENKTAFKQTPDYQSKCVYRTQLATIKLTCGGDCDGSSNGNAVTISYEKLSSPTEGL
jgi:hypothetical protein